MYANTMTYYYYNMYHVPSMMYVVGDESKRAAAVNVSVILDDG